MRIGVVFPHADLSGEPIAIRAHAQAAEDAGYTHYLAYDHVLGAQRDRPGGFTGPYDSDTPFTDPFVLFSHLAGFTSRLEFVTGVIVLPQRQTALVAKQAADVALLSNGRLGLGVGIGWNAVEYEALGQDFHTRGRRLEEQVILLRRLFTEQVVDFEGRFDRIPLAGLAPRPRAPIPIWMGGHADTVLDRVGRLADGWFPLLRDPSDLPERVERIHAAAVAAGRDPATIGIGPTLRLTGDLSFDVARAWAWQQVGATHLNVSSIGAERRMPADHIDALEDFKERWDQETRSPA
ncbi:MAG: LLM class F420-dependent oxidoreductase [Dehalococcoidia bacterium]|nr:LLM class F420-dependent oxidoreductase [Dehalococcoidia bacterium]